MLNYICNLPKNKLRIAGVLLTTALLFGCATRGDVVSSGSVITPRNVPPVVDPSSAGPNNILLYKAGGLATADIGGQTYLFATAHGDNDNSAVNVFSVADDGTLTFIDDIRDGERGANNLAGAYDVVTAVIRGRTYLFVTGSEDDAINVFSVGDDGTLTFIDDVRDGERNAYNLDGANELTTAVIGGQTYLFVSAFADDAVSVFRVADDGSLSLADNVRDGERGAYNLDGADELATAVIGGQTYLFVTAYNDNAISIFRIADDGSLTLSEDIQDGEWGANNLARAWGVATTAIGGQTYLFVAAAGDSAVSVFLVDNDGIAFFLGDIEDKEPGGAQNFWGPAGVTTATIKGLVYLFVSAFGDHAINVFSIAGDGSLSFVDDIVDGERGANNLNRATNPTTAIVGGQTYLFVPAWNDHSVSVFRVRDSGILTFVDDVKHREPK